ncbi:GDP-L-fucose synthase family protein [Flavobacterium sp. GNP001]
MEKNSKIYIAGHKGMVGSAIWRALTAKGYTNLIGAASADLDLRDQIAVQTFFSKEQPEIVIDAAARVGGILANMTAPYEFLMQNLQIQNNLIDTALRTNVSQFVFLGSSCIYPKMAAQPLKEEYLLTDYLESTNEWYAIAKIAGVKACEAIQKQYGKAFFSLMPTNLYGSYDNFDLNSSHVLPAMIRKFHEAKINSSPSVGLWGSGKPLREFLYVDDLAAAVVFALENNMTESFYNVGTGTDLSIKDLAETIKRIVGYTGTITWDASKPDGTPRKLMDVSKMKEMGWKAQVDLETGIQKTYEWYLDNQETVQQRSN